MDEGPAPPSAPPDIVRPLAARPPAVAGQFYPAAPGKLATLVDDLVAKAASRFPTPAGVDPSTLAGILVPHAGLVYSGIVAAAGWRPAATALARASGQASGAPATSTIVLLGTNHGAPWLDGVGAWDGGAWWTPIGEVPPDSDLTRAILGLGPPFVADGRCHLGEHSLEVQLPFIAALAARARIVALSAGAGTGLRAIDAGQRLGRLLAARRSAGEAIVLAISSDMAHYPAAAVAARVTAALLPHIAGLDPPGLSHAEHAIQVLPGVSCGMCGIEPAVVGLAALREMGARHGTALAEATSADAGGDTQRTVGYVAVAFGTG